MSAAAKLGLKCKLYLNTASYGSPTWVAISCVSDFQVSPKWKEGEASIRETRLELALKTLMGLEITGKLRSSNSGDANYTTIIAALLGDTQLDLMILDGDSATNGVRGYRSAFQLFDGTQDQGLNAVLYDQVMFKPCPNTDGNYNSVLIASAAPVFTAI